MTDLMRTLLTGPLNIYAVEDSVMKGKSVVENELRIYKSSLRVVR